MIIEKIAVLPRLFELKNNQLVTIKVKVESHTKPEKEGKPYKILCYTPTGYISLVFFKIFPSQISKFVIGKHFLILGNFTNNFKENKIIHTKQQLLPIVIIGECSMPGFQLVFLMMVNFGFTTKKFILITMKSLLWFQRLILKRKLPKMK